MKSALVPLIAALAMASPRPAVAMPSKCASGEIGAASKKAATKVKCWAKATAHGVAVDPACLSGAEGKFATSYAKAETKADCDTTTTAATIETAVDEFVVDLVSEIDGGTGTPSASKCSAKELTAAGKKVAAILRCYAKAAAKDDGTIVAPCIAKAQGKFAAAWAKATSAGDCTTAVDATAIETKVDDFATDVNGRLSTTPTPTTTTTCIPTTCAAQGASCGSIDDGCGGTLVCGTCNDPTTCCFSGRCLRSIAPSSCRAADGSCATGGLSTNCPCCDPTTNECVSTCPGGECCSSGACERTSFPGSCRAADGTCQNGGAAGCPCCERDGNCVSSCSFDECCFSGSCLRSLAPSSCRAADGSCTTAGLDAGCPCCDSFENVCVSSCAGGECCDAGLCEFTSFPGSCRASDGSCQNGGAASCACCQLDGTCGTTPVTCAEQGANCGLLFNGCGTSTSCGTCTAPQTCGGGGTENVCGCTDNTLACTGRVCGTAVNNCGHQISCGTCPLNKPKCCGDTCVCSTCACP